MAAAISGSCAAARAGAVASFCSGDVESRGCDEGCSYLLESPDKASQAPRFLRGRIVIAVGAACAVVIGGAVAVRRSGASSTPSPPVEVPVATTPVPYQARPGPKGTKVLTEMVDELTLAVPAGWKSPAADGQTLPGVIDAFAQQALPLASLLQAERQVEAKSAIRLFAYQSEAPYTFVSVISLSSPGAKTLTASGVAAVVAVSKQRASNVAMSGQHLPVGEVLEVDSSFVSQAQPVVVEDLVLVVAGRTVLIQMVSETNVAGRPAVFAQIAQSLRLNPSG